MTDFNAPLQNSATIDYNARFLQTGTDGSGKPIGDEYVAVSVLPAIPTGSNVIGAVTQSGTWTVTASGTVTANIGTTNGLALDASVTGLHVAQASTTSGQTGALVQGATTTSAPSYTTAKTNPLSLDTSGNLRVVQAASGTPGSAAPTVATQMGGTDGTNLRAIAVDSGGNQSIRSGYTEFASLSTSSSGTDLLPAATAGDVSAYHTVSFHFTSAGSGGQMQVQCSNDNSNWVTMVGCAAGGYGSGTGSSVSTITSTGLYVFTLNARYLRVHTTALTSGTATGVVELYTTAPMLVVGNTVNAVQSGIFTVQPGNTANTTAWKVDGSAVTQPVSITAANFPAVLAPSGTVLNTYSVHLTTNTTTTPTSSTAYISSISISSEVAGTTSTVTIQDKQGTPLKLVNGFSTTSLTTTPTVVNFQTPIKMVSGIDIVTAGAVAATVDVWINYYQ